MKRFTLLHIVMFIVIALPFAALAKPQVSMSMKAEKEVVVKKDGKETTKFVTAKNIVSGESVHYTITYENKGDEPAVNAHIDNPLPDNTVYLPGSASGEGAEAFFSIDGGKTYNRPTLLYYDVKMPDGSVKKKVASPESYTHMRWEIKNIPAGAKGTIRYTLKVK